MRLNSTQKGIIFLLFAAFFFSLMSLFVKLAGDLPSLQKAFFRNIIATFGAGIVLWRSGKGLKFDKRNLPVFFFRTLFGTIGIVSNFYAIKFLMLSDASILSKLAPFFAILFSFLFLKERIKPYQIFSVIVAFLAMLLVIKPSFAGLSHVIPALVGAWGGLMAGAAYTCVRYLSIKKENGAFIVFFFSLFSGVMLFPFLIFFYTPMSFIQIVFLICTGFSAMFAQFAVTAAYAHAPARSISVFDYTQVIFSTLMGVIVFGEFPDLLSLLGFALILSVAVFMFLKNDSNK